MIRCRTSGRRGSSSTSGVSASPTEALERLMRRLKAKYGVIYTIVNPGSRGAAVLLRGYQVRGNPFSGGKIPVSVLRKLF